MSYKFWTKKCNENFYIRTQNYCQNLEEKLNWLDPKYVLSKINSLSKFYWVQFEVHLHFITGP